jgi:ADP-ribose pyrophosphatase
MPASGVNAPGRRRTDMIERIYDGKVVNLTIEDASLPNGVVTRLEVMRHPGAAAAVPLHEDGTVTILRQWRHAAGGWLWEIPAGKLDKLGSILTTPGFCDEVIHLYLARELTPARQELERDEVIEVHRVPLAWALARIPTEEIRDAKSIAALQAAALRLGVRPA